MCLDYLKKFKIHRYEGYKYFNVETEKIKFEHYYTNKNLKTNIWIKNSSFCGIEYLQTIYGDGTYQSGFHIFKHKKDAQYIVDTFLNNCKVYKVKFRRVLAKGIQDKMQVIVANEIMILDDK